MEKAKRSTTDPTLKALRAATRGLLFPSESDRPVKPFVWTEVASDGSDTAPGAVLRAAGKIAADATVTEVPLDKLFVPVTTEQTWYGETEKARTQQFRSLESLLKEKLTDLQGFRVQHPDDTSLIDVYVVGRTAVGNIAGVQTQLVET